MMASAGAHGGESRAKAKPKAKTGGGSFWKLAAAVLCFVQVRTDAATPALCTPQGGADPAGAWGNKTAMALLTSGYAHPGMLRARSRVGRYSNTSLSTFRPCLVDAHRKMCMNGAAQKPARAFPWATQQVAQEGYRL